MLHTPYSAARFGFAASITLAISGAASVCLAPPPRSEQQQYPFLQLAGQAPTLVVSLRGGGLVSTVAANHIGPDGRISKSTHDGRYAPVEAECPAIDSLRFAGPFIAAAGRGDGAAPGVSGRWAALNFNRTRVVRGADFSDGRLLRWELGALDASSRESLRGHVVFDQGRVTPLMGEGISVNADGARQVSVVASNFRVSIEGIDARGVSRIGSIVVERAGFDGNARLQQGDGGAIDAKNFTMVVSADRAEDFESWARRSIIQGQSERKTVTIEVLNASMRETLFTLTGEGVGIAAFTPSATRANNDEAPQVAIEFFVEKWRTSIAGEPTQPGTEQPTPEPRRRPGIEFRLPIPLPR